MKLGTTDISKIYLGDTEVSKAYLGSTLVYEGDSKEYTIDDYVQDGLIFQLDGIVKGETAGSWTDLVSGNVLAPEGSPVSTNKGWTFDGNSRFHRTRWLQTDTNCTLEISGVFTSGNGVFMLYSAASGQVILYGKRFLARIASTSEDFYTSTPFSASMNMDRCVKNSSVTSTVSTTAYNTGYAETSVGKYANATGLVGTIYAIRVYNRKLTLDEQKNNIKVDSKRFGFNI